MTSYAVVARRFDGGSTVVRRATLRIEDVPSWLSTTYSRIYAFLADHGRHPAGAPFARYHRIGIGRFEVEAGYPIISQVAGGSVLENSALPSEWVATTTYSGRLADINDAYRAIASWIEENNGERSGDPWEVYLSDPQLRTDPANWRTEINQPYKDVGGNNRRTSHASAAAG
jgi:effector-binding domain-containing protein